MIALLPIAQTSSSRNRLGRVERDERRHRLLLAPGRRRRRLLLRAAQRAVQHDLRVRLDDLWADADEPV